MNKLLIVKNNAELEYDVFESGVQQIPFNTPRNFQAWVGVLRFGTGWDEGWHFMSSDDSINWNLGPNLKRAQAELRRRYADGQRKGAKGDRRRASARRRNTNGDRSRVRAKGRNARRLP